MDEVWELGLGGNASSSWGLRPRPCSSHHRAAATAPAPRFLFGFDSFTSAVDPNATYGIIMGGAGGEGGASLFGDAWRYDVRRGEWTRLG
jgi:hypothetical protein